MTIFYQVLALKLIAGISPALFYLILTAVLWSISILQMRKWRLGRMNCPRPRSRDGRTWIQTHLSEPSGPALSAVCAARGQRGILRTQCLPRSSGGCVSGLGWGGRGPCPGGPLFSGNKLPYNFSEASFFRNSRKTTELFHTESSEMDSLLPLSFMWVWVVTACFFLGPGSPE